jgi:hypothetical protein
MKLVFCLLILFYCYTVYAQSDGRIFRIQSAHAMFPDSVRNKEPRIYKGKTYLASQHYADSSAYIFVPNYFNATKPYSLVLWFHGWYSSVDSSLARLKLKEQFEAAKQNAIFIFPEGPRFSPDSYAGKFEQPNHFDAFLQEVNDKLVAENILPKAKDRNTLIVAGHSGAYNVISYILQHTKHIVKASLLFDALYGREDVFMNYLNTHPTSKLINIYTDSGGTYNNSETFLKLPERKWSYLQTDEEKYTDWDIKANNILFIHSKRRHSDVVDAFERLLKNL